MRIGIVTIPTPQPSGPPLVERVCTLARDVERLGFHGLWVTDAFARGRPTLDPLILLGALAGQTSRIELGTCVVQVPLRHPVEHAHRVQTLNLLSQGRLRFGVGSGSTKHDFDAVQADYDARFRTLTAYLEVMRKVWAAEPVYGPAISVWPGTEGGPPVLLGAWRSERWINLSAKVLQGWIASGIHTSMEDLAIGVAMFRAAGGQRAVLANIFTDFRPEPAGLPFTHTPKISLFCPPAEARDRLKRLEDLGLDDALLVCPSDDPSQLETMAEIAIR
ncbi:LLM class flavin-dependent oxidoreductase [Rhodopila sp.]|uniref:LLM class flavin-dependent oxidoreductase n=1 Tax=Rhodopila sp. TaxID=2480087 RepID=UPI002C58DC5C|nr:LLM class flavin-dependent oxidoreductase [Rhodopila sp.]HVZ09499.1 LLM class flavin-dependent oxidoreductase [Rhodopila sp.]